MRKKLNFTRYLYKYGNRDIIINITIRLGPGLSGVRSPGKEKEFFYKIIETQLWGTPRLLFIVYG